MTASPVADALTRVIDVHAHVIVPEVYAVAAEHNIFFEVPTEPGVTDAMRDRIRERAAGVLGRMSDLSDRIARMDAMGVDVQVLSAASCTRASNGPTRRRASGSLAPPTTGSPRRWPPIPGGSSGSARLPLHLPALAVGELERCMRDRALGGVAISTTAAGMELGDPALRPFWAKAEELEAAVFIHPGGNRDRRFKRYSLWNSVGQAFEEAMAISSLMYEGVLEPFPSSRSAYPTAEATCRSTWGASTATTLEKANTRINMKRPPIDYLRMLYFELLRL